MNNHPRMDKKAGKGGVLSRFLALEPRVLLDAAALETAAKVADDASVANAHDVSDPVDALSAVFGGNVQSGVLGGAGGAPEVLFVDAGVDGYASLIAGLGSNVEVHVLNGADWAGQIQAVLGRRDGDVSAIHIVSHGGAGLLELGQDSVTTDTLDAYARVWSVMKQALTSEGDLLIYGCNVAAGEDGQAFVEALSQRTGADVAASEDFTGAAALGGDWNLEVRAGQVDTALLYSQESTDFMGLLADVWVQDTEVNSTNAASGVAITRTSDGKDWKFVARSAGNAVDIYSRNTTTGVWGPPTTITGAGQFGFDVAAAGNKLAVSSPTDGTGKVTIYTYNGTNWTTTPQVLAGRIVTGSGQTGFNNGPTNNNANSGGADQFGYSIDLATDGNGNYRLIVGNPYEDWWQYDNDDNDGGAYGDEAWRYERYDAGAAWVFQSIGGTHANFLDSAADNITFVSQLDNSATGNGHLFGSVVSVAYDYDSAKWWYAAGGTGLDAVRVYGGTAAGTAVNGATFTGSYAWDSAGVNDVSMDDDYMVIANTTGVQAYKLDAASTGFTAIGVQFGSANAVVYIDDLDQSAAGDSVHGARLIYSGAVGSTLYTYVVEVDSTGQFLGGSPINTGRQEVGVALDRYRSLDAVVANGSGTQSWHFNWDPDPVSDVLATNEDATSATVNVISNDIDINRDTYGIFGDSLSISAVGVSAYGATVTFAGGTVTYNASSSSYLQTLALGQSIQDQILITVIDGQGGTSTSILTVTIAGTNDAPVVSATTPLVPLRVQQSDSTAAYDLSAYFTDIDQGENSLLEPDTVTGLPAGWGWSKNGTLLMLTIPASGATAAHGYTGSFSVSFKDPNGAVSATRNFSIQVDAVNDAPVLQNAILDQVALSQYGFSFQMPENTFFDADPSPYDVLTYTATLTGGGALPAWLTFDAATRTFSGTPTAGDTGAISIRVTANDGSLSVYDDFAITVVNPSVHTSGQFADGAAAGADFGFSMAISNNGNWMVVGSPGLNSSRGAVYVYEYSGGAWVQRGGTIQASDGVASDRFGYSVAISDDGSKIIVGARGDDGGMGSAYCYTRSGTGAATAFGSQAKMVAATRLAEDFFGTSVAINEAGTYVLIGASHYDANGLVDSGAAFMTSFGNTTPLTGFIYAKDASVYDRFGSSVAFDQNILVVSAMADDNPSGMVSRISFDDGDGTTASAAFGSVSAALQNGAQFYYDATRGTVLQLTGATGMATLSSAIDLGAAWTISSWYSMGTAGTGAYRTLTRGSSDHQIIINNGTNELGVWNNTTSGVVGSFNAIGTGAEVQQLIVKATGGNFSLTLGNVTTGPITWNTTDATLATNIQNALNTSLGAGFVTVAVTATDTFSLTFTAASGNLPQATINMAGLTGTTTGTALTTLTSGTNYSLTAAQLTGWHLITAVGEGGKTTFFIDGVKIGVSNYQATDDIVVVGNYQNGGQRFADYIDDFRVFDRALTASEIRNIYQGVGNAEAAYGDAGSLYVFSTDLGNTQVAKLYAPDSFAGDMLGWAIDVDIYDVGGSRQSGIIVASSIYNDAAANEGGAVYVWRSSSLQSGTLNNGGAGNGTWQLETKITTFDASVNTYFGNDVAVDYDEVTGGTRLAVGAPFEASNGAYSGAVYAYKYLNGVWLPEKFVDASPQGGSIATAAFFGNAVDVAGTRAVFGSRWRDTGGQIGDGAAYSVELLSQGSYATVMSVETSSMSSFALSDEASLSAFALDTSSTQGTVSYSESGRLMYSAGDAFSTLSVGEVATDSFTYFTEQGGVTYANLVQVTVYGTETGAQAMTTAADDVVTVSAAGSTLIDVLANDLAVNGGLTLLDVQAEGVLGGLLIENGKLRYDPQGAFDSLRAGESIQQIFSYTAIDGAGNTVSARVTLLVEGVDDLVVASADSATVNADGSVTVNVLANDSDRDGADTFWVSALDTSAAQGSFSYNDDGTITYVPGEAFSALPLGQSATDRIVYTVRDSTGHEYSAVLTITVLGRYEGAAGGEEQPQPVSHPVNDVAVTRGVNPIVIAAIENDGAGQIIAVNAEGAKGNVRVQDGVLQYAPGTGLAMLAAGTVYVDRFTYSVQYADGRIETATVSVHVNGTYIVSRLIAEEEDKELYAANTAAVMTPLSVTGLPDISAAPAANDANASDPVTLMALDGLIELVEQEQDAAVAEPEPSSDVPLAALTPQGKPTLAAMLMREKAARHADVTALLRHLA